MLNKETLADLQKELASISPRIKQLQERRSGIKKILSLEGETEVAPQVKHEAKPVNDGIHKLSLEFNFQIWHPEGKVWGDVPGKNFVAGDVVRVIRAGAVAAVHGLQQVQVVSIEGEELIVKAVE